MLDKKNQDSTTCCLHEMCVTYEDTHRLKVQRWKMIA